MTQEKIHQIFTNPPTLETERLILRRIATTDAEDMFSYSSSAELTRYLLWDPHPDVFYTEHYVRYLQERYAAGDYYDFAVVPRDVKHMIGTVGFTSFDIPNRSAEIGYVISPEWQGRGYASEAVMRLLALGFCDLKLERISAVCMKGNLASLKVMEKCGLKMEGLLRSAVFAKGEMRDVYLSAITKNDYFNKVGT